MTSGDRPWMRVYIPPVSTAYVTAAHIQRGLTTHRSPVNGSVQSTTYVTYRPTRAARLTRAAQPQTTAAPPHPMYTVAPCLPAKSTRSASGTSSTPRSKLSWSAWTPQLKARSVCEFVRSSFQSAGAPRRSKFARSARGRRARAPPLRQVGEHLRVFALLGVDVPRTGC